MDGKTTHHAELDIRLAVSTVPPRTTSFMPSTTELLATLPTRGWTRLFSASIVKGKGRGMMDMVGEERVEKGRGGRDFKGNGEY
jgi:hypothetical protein